VFRVREIRTIDANAATQQAYFDPTYYITSRANWLATRRRTYALGLVAFQFGQLGWVWH
jgi:hypothetical protein